MKRKKNQNQWREMEMEKSTFSKDECGEVRSGRVGFEFLNPTLPVTWVYVGLRVLK